MKVLRDIGYDASKPYLEVWNKYDLLSDVNKETFDM